MPQQNPKVGIVAGIPKGGGPVRRVSGREINEELPLEDRRGSASPQAYARRVRQEKYRDIPKTRDEKIEASHRVLFGEDAKFSSPNPQAAAAARAAQRALGREPDLPPLDVDPRATPDEIAWAHRPKAAWNYGKDISLGSVMRSTAKKKK